MIARRTHTFSAALLRTDAAAHALTRRAAPAAQSLLRHLHTFSAALTVNATPNAATGADFSPTDFDATDFTTT